jgi:hypothetical protein
LAALAPAPRAAALLASNFFRMSLNSVSAAVRVAMRAPVRCVLTAAVGRTARGCLAACRARCCSTTL